MEAKYSNIKLLLCIAAVLAEVFGEAERCELLSDDEGAAATHPASDYYSDYRDIPTLSCNPCCNCNTQYEVHVLHVHSREAYPFPVYVNSSRPVIIILVLIISEFTQWEVIKSPNVIIKEIRVLSLVTADGDLGRHQKVTVVGGETPNMFFCRQHYYMFPRPGTELGRELDQLQHYIDTQFGFMTSYTGTESAASFTLTAGQCQPRKSLYDVRPKEPATQPWIQIQKPRSCNFSSYNSSMVYVEKQAHENASVQIRGCVPCVTDGKHEVHVLHLQRQRPSYRTDLEVLLETSRKNTRVSLILVHLEPINWIIRFKTYWWLHVIEVHMITPNLTGSTIAVEGTSVKYNPRFTENKFLNMYNTVTTIEDYARNEFGYMTTYTSIDEAWEWNLNIGACLPPYDESEEGDGAGETEPDKRGGGGNSHLAKWLPPVIIIPVVFFMALFYVPLIIECHNKKLKQRHTPPAPVTIDELRSMMRSNRGNIEPVTYPPPGERPTDVTVDVTSRRPHETGRPRTSDPFTVPTPGPHQYPAPSAPHVAPGNPEGVSGYPRISPRDSRPPATDRRDASILYVPPSDPRGPDTSPHPHQRPRTRTPSPPPSYYSGVTPPARDFPDVTHPDDVHVRHSDDPPAYDELCPGDVSGGARVNLRVAEEADGLPSYNTAVGVTDSETVV